MDVSKNSGTPKSSILIGFSIINHPFWGTPIFGNTHMDSWGYDRCNRYNFLENPHMERHLKVGFESRSFPGGVIFKPFLARKKNPTLASIESWLVNDGMLMSLIYYIPHMSWFQEL